MTGDESALGINPSFLAALPENIRQEVIQEQFRSRSQRIQERAQQQAQAAASLGTGATEVYMVYFAA